MNQYQNIIDLLKNKYNSYLDKKMSLNNADLYVIIQSILPEYRLYIFKQFCNLLTQSDYCLGLKYAYTKTSEINSPDRKLSLEEVLDLFKKADAKQLMDSDYKTFTKLPNTVTIYRGTSFNCSDTAISWTLDRKRAIWFYRKYNSTGTVYKAKIKKQDIICYLDESACLEKEVIINPKKIFNLIELSKEERDRNIDFSSLESNDTVVNTDYVIDATRHVLQLLVKAGILPTEELATEIFNIYQTRGEYKSKSILHFPSGESISLYDLLNSVK